MDTGEPATEHLFTDRVLPAVLHKMRKIPLKIGIRIDPPAVIYIYKESGSLRMRSMPLRNLWPSTDVELIIEDFRNRHREHIEDVPDFALRKMINIIKKTKQGKNLEQALKAIAGPQKNYSEGIQDNDVLEKLKTNIRTSSNSGIENSSKITLQSNESKNPTGGFKKREFPKKITFGASLFDEIRIAESKMTPSKMTSKNNGISMNIPEKDFGKLQVKKPSSLEVNSFELSTSFNSLKPQEEKHRRSSFLLDLEKEMDEIESQSSKKEIPQGISMRNGFIGTKEKERQKQNSKDKERNVTKQKNDDDTDVDFDDSDNPLDDQEEDFW